MVATPVMEVADCTAFPLTKKSRKDHQLVVTNLVEEFRLQFIGLLETVGNRIWIVWDDDTLDVIILEIGAQFIHWHVHVRNLHDIYAFTIVYGANEMGARRELWQTLSLLASQCSEEIWIVGGDYNTVRDLSEVCGNSRDIPLASDEFNACIMETGLLPMSMQGEWFTWHNCSMDSRGL
ncbi:UNVERIFIED_CONTAM: hypothetical protein Sindi_0819800 [Sesamum indicum]